MHPSLAITIIEQIYCYYETWASQLDLACHRGCAACCTRNVTMTQPEGEIIIATLEQASRIEWLISRLQIQGQTGRPQITTNEWAHHCFEGTEMTDEDEPQVLTPCPFLDQHQSCSIYALRPFSCRCFGSSVDCATSGMAEQPDILMEINTVTLQLIEHLAQGTWWGNMLDILHALLLQGKFYRHDEKGHKKTAIHRYLRQACPLPGFLVMPAQQKEVQGYLFDLLAIKISGETLGKQLQIAL